ncbi:MAG TPA: hypothetical protein VGM64_19075 [Lacunisphaera sp.]|jgi:hypothetical protein
MASAVPGKIIITGTGRAGTTLLVRLLTELGLDTGYDRKNWRRDFDEHCTAGLERNIVDEDSPRIVKNPALCAALPLLLAQGTVSVEHAIIPIRALDDATHSRIRIGGDGSVPGGLMGTTQASGQKAVLAENFHGLMHALTLYEIPHTLLDFPRFALDVHYAWEKLHPVFDTIGFIDFATAFARVSDPGLIHNFHHIGLDSAGQPAREYTRNRQRKRWLRHLKRAVIYSCLFAAGWRVALLFSVG